MSLIWFVHFPSEEKVTPKCLQFPSTGIERAFLFVNLERSRKPQWVCLVLGIITYTQHYVPNTNKFMNLWLLMVVLGLTKFASRESLYFEIGWETLTERRKNRKLCIFYRMHNNIWPQYLTAVAIWIFY
jgi:hypothetical protein